ncbi:MAG: SDR family NAD(P)-dependent oxidoreductase [Paracoccaceae bacterium]
MKDLIMGKVAIVTGASRGLGRGIALTLAKEGGYTVYATARNGTALKELSAEASESELGGVVHPYVLDQNNDPAVEQFVSIVSANEGRVDVLVNSSYGGLVAIAPHFGKPFWERPIAVFDDAMNIGVRSSYVMSKFVAPIMVGQKEGLIVQTSSLGSFIYAFDVAYGVAHAGMDKLTADMAIELREHGVKTVTLHPQGGCNTELMKWPGAESTVFVGRAALSISEKASGDDLNAMNGKMVFTGELAEKYGFMHDNDPKGEVTATKIEEAKFFRSLANKVHFQNQQEVDLEDYNSKTLPWKLSDSNVKGSDMEEYFKGFKL